MTQHVNDLLNELRDLGYHVKIEKVVLLDVALGEIEEAKKNGKTSIEKGYYYENEVWEYSNIIKPELERRGYKIEYLGDIGMDYSPMIRIHF